MKQKNRSKKPVVSKRPTGHAAKVKPHLKKMLLLTVIMLLGLFVVCQFLFDIRAYGGFVGNQDISVMPNLIISAVEALSKPAPVDASTGKVYLNDGHLVLPANAYLQLRYSNVGEPNGEAQLQVTTVQQLRQAEIKLWIAQSPKLTQGQKLEAIFEQVPNLQACARGVQIFFHEVDAANGPRLEARGSKILADGRTMYLYDETTCQADQTELAHYLLLAESY